MSGRVTPARMREYLRMYLVMGSTNCREEPERVLIEALAGGATMFQFREKGEGAWRGEAKLSLARKLQGMCRSVGVPFIVNDDVELALELDADGVHIGQDDESAESVRWRIGSRILGVSAHTVDEARRAVHHGADYLGIGPIYPTFSKSDAKAAQGPAILHELRGSGIELPVVAIGGLTAGRAEEAIRAGADGVAVISAVTQAKHARMAVEEIAARVRAAVRMA